MRKSLKFENAITKSIKITEIVHCCEKCGEQIIGDGSRVMPYRCGCGEW